MPPDTDTDTFELPVETPTAKLTPMEQYGVPYWHFPFPPRAEQVESIKLLEKVPFGGLAALQLPTGLGKSPILASTAIEQGGVVITPYKMLQDQYQKDWPNDLHDFRGRENYHCAYVDKRFPPNCKHGKHLKCLGCPYQYAKREFMANPAGLTNYAAYLHLGGGSDHQWVLLDECVPGDTTMIVKHQGVEHTTTMLDVINGFGQEVFGGVGNEAGFFPIISRTRMGRKKLWEIKTRSTSGNKVLRITANGRVWCNGTYKLPSEISIGDMVSVLHGLPDTYQHEHQSIQGVARSTNCSSKAPVVPESKRRAKRHWSNVRLRMRWEDKLAERQQVQQIPTGSQSVAIQIRRTVNKAKTTDTRHTPWGWERRVRREKSERQIANSALDQKTDGILSVETGRTVIDLHQQNQGEADTGSFRRGDSVIQHQISSLHTGTSTEVVRPQKDGNTGVPEPAGRFRTSSVVDGRRQQHVAVNAQFQSRGAGSYTAMDAQQVGSVDGHKTRRIKRAMVPFVRRGKRKAVVRHSAPTRHTATAVQIRSLDAVEAGVVIGVTETDQWEETFDIGVEESHNFFANGILIHNCHALPEALMSAYSINWTKRHAEVLTGGDPYIPNTINGLGSFQTLCAESMLTLLSAASSMLHTLEAQLESVRSNRMHGMSDVPELVNRIDLLKQLCDAVSAAIVMTNNGSPYVYDEGKGGEWSAKPVKCDGLWKRWVDGMNLTKRKFAMVSATILSPEIIKSWVGDSTPIQYHEFASPFSLKRRMVYYRDSGLLSYKTMDQNFPLVLRDMDAILSKYPDLKGVVHCQSFELGQRIAKLSKHRDRFTVHRAGEPLAETLQHHISANYPSILLSPAAAEGIDLKDDLGRLNIIFKVPFPSLASSWVKAKNVFDKGWYEWTTVKTLIQQCGRTTRHHKDWSLTFILDSAFGRVYNQNLHLFPGWFCDSVS